MCGVLTLRFLKIDPSPKKTFYFSLMDGAHPRTKFIRMMYPHVCIIIQYSKVGSDVEHKESGTILS